MCQSAVACATSRSGQLRPLQVSVMRTPLGALTVSSATFAPVVVRVPRIRIVGYGRIILGFARDRLPDVAAVSAASTVGSGWATGTAIAAGSLGGADWTVGSSTGVGGGVAVLTGVAVGVAVLAGVAVGVAVLA